MNIFICSTDVLRRPRTSLKTGLKIYRSNLQLSVGQSRRVCCLLVVFLHRVVFFLRAECYQFAIVKVLCIPFVHTTSVWSPVRMKLSVCYSDIFCAECRVWSIAGVDRAGEWGAHLVLGPLFHCAPFWIIAGFCWSSLALLDCFKVKAVDIRRLIYPPCNWVK